MSFVAVLEHNLFYGLLLAVLLSIVLMGSLYVNPEIGWRTYPPAVKAAFGSMREKVRRQRLVLGLVFIALLIVIPVYDLIQLEAQKGGSLTFSEAFVSTLIVLNVFNLVDLLILDWLIFATWRPKALMLPGTEGMAEYGDYGFYFAGFLRGLLGSIIISALAGVLIVAL